MRITSMKGFCVVLFLLITSSAYAQKEVSNFQLLNAFKKISSCGEASYSEKCIDSLPNYNQQFANLLLKITRKVPSTLKATFAELRKLGLNISTSADGNFRIYSWDDRTGGTMRRYKSVFQYKVNSTVKSQLLKSGADDYNFIEIHSITVKGKKYYLVYAMFTGSSAVYYHKMKIFTIDRLNLNENARLLKTSSGIKNEIGYEVDFSASANRGSKLGFDEMYMSYNSETKTISFPLIKETGELTNRKIRYKFNGEYFVRSAR